MEGYKPLVDYSKDLLSKAKIFSHSICIQWAHHTTLEASPLGDRKDLRALLPGQSTNRLPKSYHILTLGSPNQVHCQTVLSHCTSSLGDTNHRLVSRIPTHKPPFHSKHMANDSTKIVEENTQRTLSHLCKCTI